MLLVAWFGKNICVQVNEHATLGNAAVGTAKAGISHELKPDGITPIKADPPKLTVLTSPDAPNIDTTGYPRLDGKRAEIPAPPTPVAGLFDELPFQKPLLLPPIVLTHISELGKSIAMPIVVGKAIDPPSICLPVDVPLL